MMAKSSVLFYLLGCANLAYVWSFLPSPAVVQHAQHEAIAPWKISLKRQGDKDNDNDAAFLEKVVSSVNPLYAALATAETIFWYWLAPGIDPDSRWFAPADGELIFRYLLNPGVVLAEPGYALSSLLLNSFLITPAVWALLLLQEDDGDQVLSPLPFCLAGFFVGGGALLPYMIVRRSPPSVDASSFPLILKAFETSAGPTVLVVLVFVILCAFGVEFTTWDVEWGAFESRLRSSQFTSLALLDFALISTTLLDPLLDDAARRGYFEPGLSMPRRVQTLAPFLIPLLGPVAWIVLRPKYDIK